MNKMYGISEIYKLLHQNRSSLQMNIDRRFCRMTKQRFTKTPQHSDFGATNLSGHYIFFSTLKKNVLNHQDSDSWGKYDPNPRTFWGHLCKTRTALASDISPEECQQVHQWSIGLIPQNIVYVYKKEIKTCLTRVRTGKRVFKNTDKLYKFILYILLWKK